MFSSTIQEVIANSFALMTNFSIAPTIEHINQGREEIMRSISQQLLDEKKRIIKEAARIICNNEPWLKVLAMSNELNHNENIPVVIKNKPYDQTSREWRNKEFSEKELAFAIITHLSDGGSIDYHCPDKEDLIGASSEQIRYVLHKLERKGLVRILHPDFWRYGNGKLPERLVQPKYDKGELENIFQLKW